MMKIFLTNLNEYNEGRLVGEWVTLPVSSEKLNEVKKRIGIDDNYRSHSPHSYIGLTDRYYKKCFITDYKCDIEGLKIPEFSNIEDLNEMAEFLENLGDREKGILEKFTSKFTIIWNVD